MVGILCLPLKDLWKEDGLSFMGEVERVDAE